MMKYILILCLLAFSTIAAHAEYEQVNLTVFGMDCAPCAHAIRVSMKGIQGVNTVDVDLNTGLVAIKLNSGNSAAMRQFNEAVEKNGFTHKDASVVVHGILSGSGKSIYLEVSGTKDRYALIADTTSTDVSTLIGKSVVVAGMVPQAGKGKVAETLRYRSITEAK